MKSIFMNVFFLAVSGLLISVPAHAVSGYQNNNGTCMNNGRPLCYEPDSGSPNPQCDEWVDGGSHCALNGVSGGQGKVLKKAYKQDLSKMDKAKPIDRKKADSKSVYLHPFFQEP